MFGPEVGIVSISASTPKYRLREFDEKLNQGRSINLIVFLKNQYQKYQYHVYPEQDYQK